MKRALSIMVLAGAVTLLDAAGANAQSACSIPGTLVSAQGAVLVNTGSGFSPVSVGSSVAPGSQIAVQGAGSATVSFGSAGSVSVPASSTQTVQVPGCSPQQTQNSASDAAAPGVSPAVVGPVAVTTAVVAGGIAAAISLSDSDNKAPFFPISP